MQVEVLIQTWKNDILTKYGKKLHEFCSSFANL